MRIARSPLFMFAMILAIAAPFAAFAQVGTPSGGGDTVSWDIKATGHSKIELRVTGDGVEYTKSFAAGRPVSFSLRDLPGNGKGVEDQTLHYELTVSPNVPDHVAAKLAAARAAGDDKAASGILKAAGIAVGASQSGVLQIVNGSIVSLGGSENGAARTPSTNANGEGPANPGSTVGGIVTGPGSRFTPRVNDQVIPDDLIVQSSLCVGFDCVDGESFGFDTIRLKENSTRIKFDDTSTSAGYPANDWQLTANDSASGGSNKFSVEDITGSKVPLTITAGASTNSIFVDSTGRIGARTGSPVLDFHIATSNTPAIRLEQNNSGGFTAQTWDIGGNEANFFVRSVTTGSQLPFRIRPGAPTSSIDISASGDVGVGTASPEEKLHVLTDGTAIKTEFTSTTSFTGLAFYEGNTEAALFNVLGSGFGGATGSNGLQIFNSRAGNLTFGTNNTERVRISSTGNVGINCANPGAKLVVATTASTCATPSSSMNPGDAQFTVASSRTWKENIEEFDASGILDKIEKINVYKYDFVDGPKDKIGLIAEDFHEVFNRGDEKFINGNEVQMALWLAVQELSARNKELTERLNALENANKDQQQ